MASSSAGLPGPPSRVTRRSPWYGQRGARPPPHAGGEWSRAATAADGSRRRILRRRSMLNPVIEDRRPAQDAAELGRSVPGNVMIVCGSDSEHTRSSSSQITSVDLRPELLAKIAVTTLVIAATVSTGHCPPAKSAADSSCGNRPDTKRTTQTSPCPAGTVASYRAQPSVLESTAPQPVRPPPLRWPGSRCGELRPRAGRAMFFSPCCVPPRASGGWRLPPAKLCVIVEDFAADGPVVCLSSKPCLKPQGHSPRSRLAGTVDLILERARKATLSAVVALKRIAAVCAASVVGKAVRRWKGA